MEISTKSIANFELILKFPEEMKPKFGSDISFEMHVHMNGWRGSTRTKYDIN